MLLIRFQKFVKTLASVSSSTADCILLMTVDHYICEFQAQGSHVFFEATTLEHFGLVSSCPHDEHVVGFLFFGPACI